MKVYVLAGLELDKPYSYHRASKMKAIGYSSLGGAVKYLLEQEAPSRIDHILKVASEIQLSNDKDFNEFYIEHMFFGDK